MTRAMRRIITLAIPLLLATACSHGGQSPMPSTPGGNPSGQARTVKDVTASDLHAGGTAELTFALNGDAQPAGLASNASQPLPQPGSLLAQFGGTGYAFYCTTGDIFAKQSFIGANTTAATAACGAASQTPTGIGGRVDPPDFVVATQGLTTADYTAYKANRQPATGTNFGEPFEAPIAASAIGLAYKPSNLIGLTGRLKLSRWSYCAIANGTITDWSDAAITADNGNVSVTAGASLPLKFVYRSDADGTNLALQRHLSEVCSTYWHAPYSAAPYQNVGRSAAWTGGTPSTTWTGNTGANTVAATTSSGQLQRVQARLNGTAAFAVAEEFAHLGAPKVDAALLQDENDYDSWQPGTVYADALAQANVQVALSNVESDDIRLGGAGDAGFGSNQPTLLATTRPECVLYVRPNSYVNPEQVNAYPIVEISYAIFPGKSNPHLADDKTLVAFLAASGGAADTALVNGGYATLPTAIKSAVANAVTGTNPCIQ